MAILSIGLFCTYANASGTTKPASGEAKKTVHPQTSTRASKSAPKHYVRSASYHSNTHSARAKSRSQKTTATHHGQQGIAPERAREIQQALIRERYLGGEPSGIWDQSTKDAMTRFQDDHGWQCKVVPDSRALIKLGLGPTHAGLINPEIFGEPTARSLGIEAAATNRQ
ncbi:MAG: peptidoglycan-binding domain-containing protein [Terriglobales bacterium]